MRKPLVKCDRCRAAYERTLVHDPSPERSSFVCYGCGVTLERWNGFMRPIYKAIVVPVLGPVMFPPKLEIGKSDTPNS